MADDIQQSLWNFDGAELYVIFEIKVNFIEALNNWDLETAYWRIRNLRRELDAKFKRAKKKFQGIELEKEKKKDDKVKSEKEIVDEKLSELGKTRKDFSSLENPSDEEKSKFYFQLEEFYLFLCHLMKKHGLYFREGEDSRMAVLRR